MTRPLTPLRWVRAAVLGATSVGLATAGHVAAGGHIEPVFLALLVLAAVLGGHAWLRRERGLLAIIAAVVTVQVGVHLSLTLGHDHYAGTAMVLAHAGMAVVLGLFLRYGEARVHATARRRYLQWLVTVRLLVADLPRRLPAGRGLLPRVGEMATLWLPSPGPMRGPPASVRL